MIVAQGAYGWPSCSCTTHRPRTLRVYTPTPDGYERFLRESVGLPLDTSPPILSVENLLTLPTPSDHSS
jgi:hypothetical protein